MTKSLFSDDPAYKQYVFKGLKGRYGHWPARSSEAKRTFIVLYGQHATLERISSIAEMLREFGDVYSVDLPGFGGMESPYSIKQSPTLDFYAEHLLNFIDNYLPAERKLTLMGISYSFQIVTKTLSNYPDLSKRTEGVISFVGFANYKDFDMPLSYKILLMYILTNISRTYLGSKLMDVFISKPVLRVVYFISKPLNVHTRSMSRRDMKEYVDQQAWLWIASDNRTHAATAWEFFRKTDLTNLRIKATVYHAGVVNDHYFKNAQIVEELNTIYEKCQSFDLNLGSHAPLEAKPDEVRSLLPDKLKAILMKSSNKVAVKR